MFEHVVCYIADVKVFFFSGKQEVDWYSSFHCVKGREFENAIK